MAAKDEAAPSKTAFGEPWPSEKKSKYNYLTLADLIGRQPGLAIFRRFATLNAKNLLYLQAEIAELEDLLDRAEVADQNASDETRRKYQWEARLMMSASGEGGKGGEGGEGGEQWRLMLNIRDKLKQYSLCIAISSRKPLTLPDDLLLQHQRLYTMPLPNAHDLEQLRGWLERPEYGAFFLERPEDVWDTRNTDLVALSSRIQEGDRFSRWLTDIVVPFFHRRIIHRPRGDDAEAELDATYDYSDKRLNRVAEVFSIIISTLLPTVSIFALYYITEPVSRLGFVLAFSAVFTACLAIFTTAKRIEIFAAAVTLASVQVVFIGNIPLPPH